MQTVELCLKLATRLFANVGETVSTTAVGTVKTCPAVGDSAYASANLTVSPFTVTGSGDSKITKNLPAGTYSVQAKVLGDDDKVVTVNGSFTIKDTQDTHTSFKILDNKFGTDTTVASAFANKNLVEIYYDGLLQTHLTSSDITDIKGVVLGSGANGGAYLKTLSVMVKVAEQKDNAGQYNYVKVTLNVNDQIATCASTDIKE